MAQIDKRSNLAGKKRHLHFMGIGGVGMSGLARWYKCDGYRVSGCDSSPSSIVDALVQEDIAVFVGHSASHFETNVDTLISTMAVADTHPEILAARECRCSEGNCRHSCLAPSTRQKSRRRG